MALIENIFIDQDADFSKTITAKDSTGTVINLSGFSVAAMLRKNHLSSTSVSFTTSIASASDGTITITLTDTQTAALEAGRFVYDVVITSSGGLKTRVVEGQATINPSVTR
tara:strand:+ start:618 stop:950 length:333 start_codon:yes stop_codon:yes gene_type:complete